ncbi:MAG: hypothetical protein EBY29_00635 [Planctomycetes bacterium]|nr:hypothetical protein [Planctomycetota bacterium]
MSTIGPEFYDMISGKALKNCTEEFNELARQCAIGLATYRTHFDGSQLTDLMQIVDPDVWPCTDQHLIGYYRNSELINFEVTMARQRNYFTSAANLYLPMVAHRGGKVDPQRSKTHDRVCLYTSKYYGQQSVSVDPKIVNAVQNLP